MRKCYNCRNINETLRHSTDWVCPVCKTSAERLTFEQQLMSKMRREMMLRSKSFRVVNREVIYP